ncbi:MAG: TatD family hydrolase [Acidobacteriaceae bacterium]
MLIDSHAHLDSDKYDGDREAVLTRAGEAGVRAVLAIGIGEGPATMQRAFEISREFAGRNDVPAVWATAGIHPDEAANADQAAYDKLDRLLAEPEVIAAGEIGLDYYWNTAPHAVQQDVFVRQMEIAAGRKRPIIIHCRASEEKAGEPDTSGAWDDTLELIESHWKRTGLGGILHCFTGELEHARRALECGFLISFAGNITFPKAQAIRDVAVEIPLDRMLVETDAPYLAPVPFRGKRNEPAFVAHTAAKIAELLRIEVDEVAAATARNFFGLMRLQAPDGLDAVDHSMRANT